MSQYVYPNVLVDTQWLVDHLDDPMVRIVELDMTPELYHIPGAVYWNIFTDFMRPDLSMNLEPDTIGKLLSRSGISPETTVIGYGSSVCTGAILFWLLRMFGHDNVYVLDGGYQKWIAEDRPLVTEFSNFASTQYQVSLPDTSLRVIQQEVQASLNRSDCVLLDVRTVPEFRGEIFMEKPPEGAECGGHIPGAINVDYTQTLHDDETFKSYEELHTFFVSQGITADKEVFPYCAVGGRSAFIWFVLKYLLGYPRVRNYDGSWNEWGRLPNAPIEQ